MTIDPVTRADSFTVGAIALAAWFGGLILLTPLLEPTRDVLVFGPATTIAALPTAGAALVDAAGGWTRVRRTEDGFVRRLYAQGAWIVFPAFEGGCNRPVRVKAI